METILIALLESVSLVNQQESPAGYHHDNAPVYIEAKTQKRICSQQGSETAQYTFPNWLRGREDNVWKAE